jgi:hypothetical protein
MGKPDDPYEFDPFADPEPAPAAKSTPAPARHDLAAELFDEPVAGPAPKPVSAEPHKALRLDFSDVLGSDREVRGAQRIGAGVLDTGEFLSKEDRAALERAAAAPRADLPSSIDLEQRMAGVRVVAESRRYWVWLVLLIAIPLVLVVGGVWTYVRIQQSRTERELKELRGTEETLRRDQQKREQQLLH